LAPDWRAVRKHCPHYLRWVHGHDLLNPQCVQLSCRRHRYLDELTDRLVAQFQAQRELLAHVLRRYVDEHSNVLRCTKASLRVQASEKKAGTQSRDLLRSIDGDVVRHENRDAGVVVDPH